mmetsp:Transcript_12640/g.36303  ORF Transcript_12640/g.36303 Transcript_12640/m.36303 type:complete len:233 (+) Transcript_12640:2251-2949(+)
MGPAAFVVLPRRRRLGLFMSRSPRGRVPSRGAHGNCGAPDSALKDPVLAPTAPAGSSKPDMPGEAASLGTRGTLLKGDGSAGEPYRAGAETPRVCGVVTSHGPAAACEWRSTSKTIVATRGHVRQPSAGGCDGCPRGYAAGGAGGSCGGCCCCCCCGGSASPSLARVGGEGPSPDMCSKEALALVSAPPLGNPRRPLPEEVSTTTVAPTMAARKQALKPAPLFDRFPEVWST